MMGHLGLIWGVKVSIRQAFESISIKNNIIPDHSEQIYNTTHILELVHPL